MVVMRRTVGSFGWAAWVPALIACLATSRGAAAATTARADREDAARTSPAPVLPWIADDYTRAVAQAKARKLPIFVESWAPW